MSSQSRFITTKKLSEQIGISVYTVQKWVREKKIPAHLVGKLFLFDPEEVDRAIKKFKIN
jgi:excisionase family DNA binding protein